MRAGSGVRVLTGTLVALLSPEAGLCLTWGWS